MATRPVIVLVTSITAGFLLLLHPKAAPCSEGHFGAFDVNIIGRTYAYFQSNPGVKEGNDPFGETKINLTYSDTFHNGLFLKLSSRFQIDTDHKSEGVIDSYKDNEQHRKVLDINEGFIEHRLGLFDYFIGKRIFSWGKGDHFNLTDKINPKDCTDFLDNEKMGVLLAGFTFYPTGNSQAEICFIPFFNRSRIPLTDSRWAPCCNSGLQIEEEIPSDSMQYASRYSLYLKNLDIDLTYMRRIEDLATVVAVPNPLVVGPPALVEKYRKMNLYSVEGTTTIADRLEFHAGATYHDIDRREIYGQFIQYLLGINYTIDEKVLFNKSVKLIGEYLGDIDVDKPENEKLVVLDLVRMFENSLFLRIDSTLTDFSNFQIGNLVSLKKRSNDILRLEYKYSPNDKLELKVGSDFIWGNGELIFDQFEKNDRIWACVKYLF